MRTDVVFTLTGPDRVGIVEDVTAVVLRAGGNVETSRMVRLGGEFAIIMQVSLAEQSAEDLEAGFAALAAQGYLVSVRPAATVPEAPSTSHSYRIEIEGADHEGIVHDIAAGLAASGINIESLETATSTAAVSGITLFSMSAHVAVPQGVSEEWQTMLAEAAHRANVDVTIWEPETA